MPITKAVTGFGGEYYFDVWEHCGCKANNLENARISAIIIPEYGYSNLEVTIADKELATKRIIKSLTGFQAINAEPLLLQIMKRLLNVPIIKVNMSSDMMTQFADAIINYLKE